MHNIEVGDSGAREWILPLRIVIPPGRDAQALIEAIERNGHGVRVQSDLPVVHDEAVVEESRKECIDFLITYGVDPKCHVAILPDKMKWLYDIETAHEDLLTKYGYDSLQHSWNEIRRNFNIYIQPRDYYIFWFAETETVDRYLDELLVMRDDLFALTKGTAQDKTKKEKGERS